VGRRSTIQCYGMQTIPHAACVFSRRPLALAAALVFSLFLAAATAFVRAPAAAAAVSPVLVIAAHPDDEALGFSGVIESALAAGRPVYVAVVTNGAAVTGPIHSPVCGAADGGPAGFAEVAVTRDQETKAAMGFLGVGNSIPWTANVSTSHIFFLGYPDTTVATIAAGGSVTDPSGLNHTFAYDGSANDVTCDGDYHHLWAGSSAPLTQASLRADLDHLLAQVQPGDIYTHVVFDGHPDHAAVAREVARAVLRSSLTVAVHGALIHETGNGSCQSDTAAWWPNPEGTSDPVQRSTPTLPFTAPPIFATSNDTGFGACPGLSTAPVGHDWGPFGPPTEVPVPADMQLTDLNQNEKWQTISHYESQLGCPSFPSCGYLHGFVKSDEIFWTQTLSATGAPVPIDWPRLSGTGSGVGDNLSVHWPTTAGDAFLDSPTSFDYQWLRCDVSSMWQCNPIAGAIGTSYTAVAQDSGWVVRLRVVAHNAAGAAPTVYSGATDPIQGAPTNLTLPAITGVAADGSTLTASNGTWSAAPPVTSYTYQWQTSTTGTGGWSNLASATASTYQIQHGDVNHYLRVEVTAPNSVGAASADSGSTVKVVASAPSNTAVPVISGTPKDGSTLTGSNGSWNGTPSSYAYQWLRCTSTALPQCTPIAGATSSSYVAEVADVGLYLRFQVTATNAQGSAVAVSDPVQIDAVAPVKTADPTISGTAQAGQTLSSTPGTFSGSQATITYQWQRSSDGTSWSDVADATASTYAVPDADVGFHLRVLVTATNSAGHDTGTSATTGTVAAAPSSGGGGGGGGGTGGGGGSTGSGGGGGGSGVADLRLEGTVEPQQAAVGDTITWRITVNDFNTGPALDVYVDIQLPSSVSLVSSYADRGTGCTVVADNKLHCYLDWLADGAQFGHVILVTKVTATGDHVLTAVTGYRSADPVPADNSLTLTGTTPAPFVPPPTPVATTPTIRIVKATVAKSGIVTLKVAIKGWTINTKQVKKVGSAAGYWVIYVDGKRNAISRLATTGVTTKLARGAHRLRVELVRENGTLVSPRALSQVVVVRVPKRTVSAHAHGRRA
jgi:uncharacterized repeat protein (TIGR01451 family)